MCVCVSVCVCVCVRVSVCTRKVRQKGMKLSRRRRIKKRARITADLRTTNASDLAFTHWPVTSRRFSPPSFSVHLMSLIPCISVSVFHFLHSPFYTHKDTHTHTHTHTHTPGLFLARCGVLKVELCRPLVSPQLQALQGPPDGHGCPATARVCT